MGRREKVNEGRRSRRWERRGIGSRKVGVKLLGQCWIIGFEDRDLRG